MNNYYAIETEVEFRRREWQRAVEADARSAQVCTGNGRKHWPQLSLTTLRSFLGPRLPFSSPLAARRRSVAC
jgi:hypothetical protein